MASAIDDTKPIAGTPTTQSVRDQFATAKSEITALQAQAPVTWTVGSVAFAASTTALTQDNANLFWDNTGKRLGIGTSAPTSRLTVSANTSAPAPAVAADTVVYAIGADGGVCRVLMDTYGPSQPILTMRHAAGTATAPTAIGGGLELGRIIGQGYGATAFSSGRTFIGFPTTQAWTDANQGAAISFATTPNDTTATAEALRIDHNGNVGIGTSGPLAKLEVVGGLGLVVGAPTGGALASGKINAIEVRANNVVLTSDADLKTDIKALPPALPIIAAIEPKSFLWKPLPEPERPDAMLTQPTGPADFTERFNRGFLAQDVIAAIGGKVEDGVDMASMLAILWQAVRELTDRVAELEGDKPAPRH